jgi:hypothetical protein
MTFTAIRPEAGLSNGREVSLFSVSQASALISALSVVLRDLYGSLAPRKYAPRVWLARLRLWAETPVAPSRSPKPLSGRGSLLPPRLPRTLFFYALG